MKLYVDSGRAPNPRRVRIFLAEKGVTLPTEPVDLGAQAHKAPQFRAINPMQRLPALVLDDGTVIAESIAICRYVEALHPARSNTKVLIQVHRSRVGRATSRLNYTNRLTPYPYRPTDHDNAAHRAHSARNQTNPFQRGVVARPSIPANVIGARPTSRARSSFSRSLTASSRSGRLWPARAFPSPTSPRWSPSIS